MGLACEAKSSLVYGVVLETPENLCWPLLLKRLKEVAADDKVLAESERNEGDGQAESTEVATLSVSKKAKTEKAEINIFFDCEDDKEQLEKEDVEESDDIFYICEIEDDIQSESQKAFDKVLGQQGHGIVLKPYVGHNEDTVAVELLLQMEGNCVYGDASMNSNQVSTVPAVLKVVNKAATDEFIAKILELFGLKSEVEPSWILVSECRFYP